MITGIEISTRAPFVDGASFGSVGAYERIDGVAIGALDPAHPRNRGIALLDQAPRDADGLVGYRSDFVLRRQGDADRAAGAGGGDDARQSHGAARGAGRARLDLRGALPGDEAARRRHRLRRDAGYRQPPAAAWRGPAGAAGDAYAGVRHFAVR